MNKELSVRKMLSRYNRRTDDETVRNYMDVCFEYSNEEVDSVTRYLTAICEKLPYPRDIEVALLKEKRKRPSASKCERCGGPGYYREDQPKHLNGLTNFEDGRWLRCYCATGEPVGAPPLAKRGSVRSGAIATIFAGKVAERAIDNKVISSVEQWAFYCWTPDTFKMYKLLAEDMTMRDLLHVGDVLKSFDALDCQTIPLEIAKEIKKQVKVLPDKELVKTIGK